MTNNHSEMIENPFLVSHISYQEGILQNSRNLHYVFQALFLGISFAFIALQFAIVFSSPEDTKLVGYLPFIVLVLTLLNMFVIQHGRTLMKDYAEKIYKRGVVIDFLHHLKILEFNGKIEIFLRTIFYKNIDAYVYKNHDIVFLFIKYIERVSDNYGKQYFGESKILTPNINILPSLDFYILRSVIFCNDIYDTSYLDGFFVPHQRRKITDTRNGHFSVFSSIWLVFIAISIFVFFIGISRYLS